MRFTIRTLVLSLASLLLATGASATSYTISAALDGAQEVPPVATPATGTLTGTYDDVTNFLSWSGVFSGLIGTTTTAHFHGPAAPGASAGVAIGITASTGDVFPIGVTSGAYSGTATLSAAHETQLLSGLWYVNIHSTFKTGGEIRGQISATAVPEPSTLALIGLGLLVAARARR